MTSVKDIAHGVPPFPLVRETLVVEAAAKADCMVISQTPTDALEREWAENDLDGFVSAIAGQELGTKTQHLNLAAKDKYAPEKILMIGDAPGDHNAANANGALFFPINPGDEEASWKRLHRRRLGRNFPAVHSQAITSSNCWRSFEKCSAGKSPVGIVIKSSGASSVGSRSLSLVSRARSTCRRYVCSTRNS